MSDSLQSTFYLCHTMDSQLVDKGLSFIRRRFSESWGIFRSDVDCDRIYNRSNIVLTKNGEIVGWLGLEADGELANACIEKGMYGVPLLERMIRDFYTFTDNEYYYAETPILKSGSTGAARIFLMAGMHLKQPLYMHTISYSERKVDLVRLEIYRSENPDFTSIPSGIEENLRLIKEVKKNGTIQ